MGKKARQLTASDGLIALTPAEVLNYLRTMIELTRAGELQGIHFWSSVYVVMIMAFTLSHILRVRRWPHTQGQLLQCGTRALNENTWRPSETLHVPNAHYRYEVNGQTYEGRELSVWKVAASGMLRGSLSGVLRQVSADSNGQVRVYYHPKRPATSLLIRPGWASLAFTVSCLLGTVAFYLWRWA